jgi:archaellum component FlaC
MTLEELEKRESELWDKYQAMSRSIEPVRSQWAECHKQLESTRLREQIKAEMLAEQKKDA